MHPPVGELQAFIDQELPPERVPQIEDHLASCSTCQSRLAELQTRGSQVGKKLARLEPSGSEHPLPISSAYNRYQQQLNKEQETNSMWKNLFTGRARLVWVIVIVLGIFAVTLAFPPARAIANNFLGLFRVQKVVVLPVDPGALPSELGSSAQLEALMSDDVKIENHSQAQEVANAAEASSLADIPVRLPSVQDSAQALLVQPGGRVTITIDVARMRALLQEIGRADIQVPQNLDGEHVVVDVPSAVIARYGRCEMNSAAGGKPGFGPDSPDQLPLSHCTILSQMKSPVVSAPPDLDINQVGQAFLQVLGMTPEEALSFSQTVDWTTTFVIPIPRYDANYEDVVVDGVPATLITRGPADHVASFLLIWIKDDILYSLSGPGDSAKAMEIAGSLQ